MSPGPRYARRRRLVAFLRATTVLVVALAAAAVVLPPDEGRALGVAMAILLAAVPVVRVGWLAVRWARLGDLRFAAAAAALVGIVVFAAVV
jgi:Na+/proline symporter